MKLLLAPTKCRTSITGRFVAMDLEAQHLPDELARLAPAECLIPEGAQALADSRSLRRAALLHKVPY